MLQQTSFLDSLCGKTYPEPSAVTKGKTSRQSYKRFVKSGGGKTILYLCLKRGSGFLPDASWETVGVSHGEFSTLNFSERPSVAVESTLSQILEANAPEKYWLSAKACAGILRRASKRGKKLPPMLKEALEEAVRLGSENHVEQ